MRTCRALIGSILPILRGKEMCFVAMEAFKALSDITYPLIDALICFPIDHQQTHPSLSLFSYSLLRLLLDSMWNRCTSAVCCVFVVGCVSQSTPLILNSIVAYSDQFEL